MKPDITRLTYQPTKHFSRTVQQQGRVPLDADLNEQVDIQAHYDRADANDVIGPVGVPEDYKNGQSFLVDPIAGTADFRVWGGRMWVDGILCELEDGTVPVSAIPAATSVQLATATLDGLALRPGEWIELSAPKVAAKLFRVQ